MPRIDENVMMWGSNHTWSEHGDEWSDQARHCGQPYPQWKAALAGTFLLPNVRGKRVLEIGPGHGRWTELYVDEASEAILVDVTPACVEYCKVKFKNYPKVRYFLNDGDDLSLVSDGTIDFIWSYDVFVHIETAEINAYLREFARVLKPGAKAIIHHADRSEWRMFFRRVLSRFGKGYWAQNAMTCLQDSAVRSQVSTMNVHRAARAAGLRVIAQTDSWGDTRQYNCRLFNDKITEISKPS